MLTHGEVDFPHEELLQGEYPGSGNVITVFESLTGRGALLPLGWVFQTFDGKHGWISVEGVVCFGLEETSQQARAALRDFVDGGALPWSA
jgi:hypothetical protein